MIEQIPCEKDCNCHAIIIDNDQDAVDSMSEMLNLKEILKIIEEIC